MPGGPRAAGKRDPGQARSGAAAAAPAKAPGRPAVGGAEPPWPRGTVAERAAGAGGAAIELPGFPGFRRPQSADFARFRLPPQLRGGTHRGEGSRLVASLRRSLPRRAAQVRSLPALLPAHSRLPPQIPPAGRASARPPA